MTRPTTHRRERRRAVGADFGHRARSAWDAGDLPAPYAVGDLVRYPEHPGVEQWQRMTRYRDSMDHAARPGELAVVTYCPSIDDGDAWYVRLSPLANTGHGSDRLHVVWADRCSGDWKDDVNFMAGVELVDTADPEGLAARGQLIRDGWTCQPVDVCPTCGGRR